MIKIIVKTNTERSTVVGNVDNTPKSVFENAGISTEGSTLNLNGTFLNATDLHSSFSALGVEDGATVSLNAIVKADGANK